MAPPLRPRLRPWMQRCALALPLLPTPVWSEPLPSLVPAPTEAPSSPPSPLSQGDDLGRLRLPLSRFSYGDYQAVVDELATLVDRGALAPGGGAPPGASDTPSGLTRADRLEALRAWAIACAVLGRTTAAEGAFLLLLEAEPQIRLDVAEVRPEAITVFERVRARHRDELLALYRKSRGRRYAVLNLLPPAGQLQNRDYRKGYALLGVEVALLALDVTSASLLYSWRGPHEDYPGHESAAAALRPANWASFGALLVVLVYGVIDGFVVGHHRAIDERRVEDELRGGTAPSPTRAMRPALELTSDAGVGLRF